MKKRTIIYCVVAAIVLSIVSFVFVDLIFDLLYSPFKNDNISFLVTDIGGSFSMAVRISLSIGITPILLMITLIKGNISSPARVTGSIAIVIATVAVAILANNFRIHSYPIPDFPQFKFGFPVEKLFFDRAIVLGAAAGSVVAYFSFRNHKRSTTQPSLT